jgi:hypothetical protein
MASDSIGASLEILGRVADASHSSVRLMPVAITSSHSPDLFHRAATRRKNHGWGGGWSFVLAL